MIFCREGRPNMKACTKRRYMERKIVEKLVEGIGVNQICRELRVSKRRVRFIRARACEAGYLSGKSLPAPPEAIFSDTIDGRSTRESPAWNALYEHLPWIKERLEGGWHAVTVYEELPIRVPRSNFYRFLVRHKLGERGNALRVIPEIVHEPGEALLIDWGLPMKEKRERYTPLSESLATRGTW